MPRYEAEVRVRVELDAPDQDWAKRIITENLTIEGTELNLSITGGPAIDYITDLEA